MVEKAILDQLNAKSDSELRGDYSKVAPDFTVEQDWSSYSEAEHDRWRRLFTRQRDIVAKHGCHEFNIGLELLECADGIPDFARANERLGEATGWQIVAVPGFIPDKIFFDHLAAKRFPVTSWIREESELDYLVEPDVFHDFFGHVPMLSDQRFADFMQAYGQSGEKAMEHGALDMLARIYWYTVEFGLVKTGDDLKAFGAGILSSAGETIYSVGSEQPNRVMFETERVMRTGYMIDDYQKTYFVIESFDALMDALFSLDFAPIYDAHKDSAPFDPAQVLDRDTVIHRGTIAREPQLAGKDS